MVNQSKTGRWSISQRLGDGQSTGDGEMVNQLETEMVKQSETGRWSVTESETEKLSQSKTERWSISR